MANLLGNQKNKRSNHSDNDFITNRKIVKRLKRRFRRKEKNAFRLETERD